ncbi:hypothetical protein LMG31884_47040 (plasmid) [Xanthomonas hydrangeae]|uniref:hypothetical protein n=1 Tax=Xanthomonas hydrangeae TaxID=2775159 RepID=UPI00196605EE|nr:hypothetical protein LMG31884_47040 [Xanthomonas hydrangeae]CAD7740912.1 hypothetical protein LMG31884_47040 [Xanthomonas hydrangeae]CAD7748274.1 hypothetical protein LMG31885_45540 [Xanthomonas hydrangeae]CAD7748275.1 hypothetical protein LMG31885_45540 [Xanthomonas hydrangeae]
MAAPKKPAEKKKPAMRLVPLRLTDPNWERLTLAKLTTRMPSLQEIMFEGVQLWLKKNKLDPLDPQGGNNE